MCAYVLTLLLIVFGRYSTVYWYVFNNFQTLMAAAEVVRRMVWGFLRLEWEHIEKYGAAPVSRTRQHAVRRGKVSAQTGPEARGGINGGMTKMPLAGDIDSSVHSKFFAVVEWEWVVYFSDWCDQLLKTIPFVARWSSGYTFPANIWIARIVEAVALTTLIITVIAVAAFG